MTELRNIIGNPRNRAFSRTRLQTARNPSFLPRKCQKVTELRLFMGKVGVFYAAFWPSFSPRCRPGPAFSTNSETGGIPGPAFLGCQNVLFGQPGPASFPLFLLDAALGPGFPRRSIKWSFLLFPRSQESDKSDGISPVLARS